LIFGEVWIERGSGERHATMASVWRLSLRVAMGVTLVVLALVNADGSGAALLILFGAWLILAGLVLGAVLLRETREQGRKPADGLDHVTIPVTWHALAWASVAPMSMLTRF